MISCSLFKFDHYVHGVIYFAFCLTNSSFFTSAIYQIRVIWRVVNGLLLWFRIFRFLCFFVGSISFTGIKKEDCSAQTMMQRPISSTRILFIIFISYSFMLKFLLCHGIWCLRQTKLVHHLSDFPKEIVQLQFIVFSSFLLVNIVKH